MAAYIPAGIHWSLRMRAIFIKAIIMAALIIRKINKVHLLL